MSREGSWERRLWEDFTNNGQSLPTVNLGTNNGAGDAFGRLRVTEPTTLFDSQFQYDTQPLLWDTKTTGTASEAHLPNESAVSMTVASAASYDKKMGYGDGENGVFMGYDDTGVYVLLRSSNTGSVVDTRKVYQDSWNLDRMDGVGYSGKTLDITKTQIVVIDLEWLGVGRVRVGLNIDGVSYYVHEFLNANVLDKTYMTTANLPVRYEISNGVDSTIRQTREYFRYQPGKSQFILCTGLFGTDNTMKHICSTVVSEGGVQSTLAYPFSTEILDVSMGNGVGNAAVIFATRHATTFNSITNRGRFEPISYEVAASGGDVVARVVYDPVLAGGTWAAVDSNSFMEGNSTVTSFSGGINVGTSIITGGANKNNIPLFGKTVTSRLPFGLGIDADDPIPLALIAYATSANVTASFTFQWEELR